MHCRLDVDGTGAPTAAELSTCSSADGISAASAPSSQACRSHPYFMTLRIYTPISIAFDRTWWETHTYLLPARTSGLIRPPLCHPRALVATGTCVAIHSVDRDLIISISL